MTSISVQLPDAKTAAICVSLGLLGFLVYRHTLLQSELKRAQKDLNGMRTQMEIYSEELANVYAAEQDAKQQQQKNKVFPPSRQIPPPVCMPNVSNDDAVLFEKRPFSMPELEHKLDDETREKIQQVIASKTMKASKDL